MVLLRVRILPNEIKKIRVDQFNQRHPCSIGKAGAKHPCLTRLPLMFKRAKTMFIVRLKK